MHREVKNMTGAEQSKDCIVKEEHQNHANIKCKYHDRVKGDAQDPRNIRHDDVTKLKSIANKEQNLKKELDQIEKDQDIADKILLDLIKEEEELLKNCVETNTEPSEEEIHHYKYILPLVKEVYLLELKVKEKQEIYSQQQLQYEMKRQQSDLLADCLSEKESMLKYWAKSLLEWNQEDGPACISHVQHSASHDPHDPGGHQLTETLTFTLLCHMVSVRLKVKVNSYWPSLLYGHPQPRAVGVKSDMFIPGLSERVVLCFHEKRHVESLIEFLEAFLIDEVAPFAIICPVKKSKKKPKIKEK